MAENTKIEWCDHTFNPWIGCTKVSAGCQHCYAETLMDKRYKKVKWGPRGQRVRTSANNWKKPLAWNKKASGSWMRCGDCGWTGDNLEMHGERLEYCPMCDDEFSIESARPRVFCASLADVFEEKLDQPELDEWRRELFELIQNTSHLDWLLLTKRPENVCQIIEHVTGFSDAAMWFHSAPHVWVGTSVENQAQADKRIPELLEIPARVRFLSMEPLLDAIDLCSISLGNGLEIDALRGKWGEFARPQADCGKVDWVIVGGESGENARPMHPDWARDIRDQCLGAGVPIFFKQWGEWIHESQIRDDSLASGTKYMLYHCKHTAEDIGIMARRSRYRIHSNGGFDYYRVGKKAAGRLLDGRTWDEFPQVGGS